MPQTSVGAERVLGPALLKAAGSLRDQVQGMDSGLGEEGLEGKWKERSVERQTPRPSQRKKQVETGEKKKGGGGTGHTEGQKLRPERLGTAARKKPQMPGPRYRIEGK